MAHVIEPGVSYVINNQHRNGTPTKSQWNITEDEELDTFRLGRLHGWVFANEGWSLHVVNGIPAYLGVGTNRNLQLFIARFRKAPHVADWHGYPIDPARNHDRPVKAVTDAWLRNRILRKSTVRKIISGQPCKL